MSEYPEKVTSGSAPAPSLSRRLRLFRHQIRIGYEAFRIPQAAGPGHFYSPIPSLEEVRHHERELFRDPPPDELARIDLNVDRQLGLVKELAPLANDHPFPDDPQSGVRYYFNNDFFPHGDALMLLAMLRHLNPRRVIEIGSGFSSAVMLDANERFLRNSTEFTFIEPYPARLTNLMRDEDRASSRVIPHPLQDVDLTLFSELKDGDVLFIDSSHTLKIGSDVSRIFFDIIPNLSAGVIVHIHDIYYPFEYPKSWVYQGRYHNEAYLLRAFLLFNDSFQIEIFNSYLEEKHAKYVSELIPDLEGKRLGGSIWLRKTK
jgi:hypothetical protein